MKVSPLVGTGLVLALGVSLAAAPGESWRMKADYVEACSCHLFCQCYFNKQAEHPMCEFNMAVTVREGHSGNVDLANAKYGLTGDLGDKWGSEKKATWVTVSFDPKTTQEQRDALAQQSNLHFRRPGVGFVTLICGQNLTLCFNRQCHSRGSCSLSSLNLDLVPL